MTRALLSISICVLCVGLGLASARAQAQNHSRAASLDELKRRCDLIEAGNEALRYRIQMRHAEIERGFSTDRSDELASEEWPER